MPHLRNCASPLPSLPLAGRPRSRRVAAITPDRSGTGAVAPVHAEEEMLLAQLLCARLCHDLIGPATAINAGQELLGCADDAAEAGDLLADSARQLAGRLTFFRAVFGHAGGAAQVRVAELQALAHGYLAGRRIALDWQFATESGRSGDDGVAGDTARIVLCLIMLVADTLPRGGQVVLHADCREGTALSVTAAGRTVRLADDVRDALQATVITGITARTVHAYYLCRLLQTAGRALLLDTGAEAALQMQVSLPAPRADLSCAA